MAFGVVESKENLFRLPADQIAYLLHLLHFTRATFNGSTEYHKHNQLIFFRDPGAVNSDSDSCL
jgi:hypothetical protein